MKYYPDLRNDRGHFNSIPTVEILRDAGYLVCRCPAPRGEPDGECAQCRRYITPAPARLAYLRNRRRTDGSLPLP